MPSDTRATIGRLVERFANHRESYAHSSYKEAQLRQEFIDPMWKALGWDIDNQQGYAEQYKDVIHEDAIKVSADAYTKAPDYCFRIGGIRKFFLEAKKPSVNVTNDPEPAFQLRRYAWSAKMPLSVLTDFEELVVYDTRVKPVASDKASVARIMVIPFTEYVERWDELEGIFSREAVLKGSFDKYADSNKKKRGTASVDAAFLDEIEAWRDELARNIAIRNDDISQPELNFAVQVIIDRIVFLRICEDRGIEEYGTLLGTSNGTNLYIRLVELFDRADKKYNSGLFHFSQEKGRTAAPDSLTPRLAIDDAVLKRILRSLYYPDSPYEFSVLPADILGQVYEQFLGKVIRLTPGHQAKVEEKPEVKKAGGVYYTPTYIVDYIVKNTIGPLLEGKAPKQISGGKQGALRILDPACGSGTFLLQAYQYLLDWYRDAYVAEDAKKNSKGRAPVLFQASGGEWRLTTSERKRVLLTHIFGVDIDSQAVEVTKLSLLLKVLEGESDQTLQKTLQLFQERALPDLDGNIKSGNSLIGSEFYEQAELVGFDDATQRRVNAFDWRVEFPQVFSAKGGFDATIGNPPYIRIQALRETYPVEADYYIRAYRTGATGNFDIYVLFVERGLSLLNDRGRLGFILPHKFFNAQYGEALRALIATGKHLNEVVHFGVEQVFADATTYTALLFLSQAPNEMAKYAKVASITSWRAGEVGTPLLIGAHRISSDEWNFAGGDEQRLLDKLRSSAATLESVTDRIFQGIKTSADKVYILDEVQRTGARVKVYSRETEAEHWLESSLLHPLIKGGDSERYRLSRTSRLILFPYKANAAGRVELVSEEVLKQKYPLSWEYLLTSKEFLQSRENGKLEGANWYAFGRTQALDVIAKPKIFTPDIAPSASYSVDPSGEVFFTGGVAGGYGILVGPSVSREYVLGLLNSRVLEWCVRQVGTQMRGGYYSFEARFIRDLPVPIEAGSNPQRKTIEGLVARMLDLKERLAATSTAPDQRRLERDAGVLDRQIDEATYELFDLTAEEISLVETQTARG